MALDLPIPNQAEKKITQAIITTDTRVSTVIFDFNNTQAVAFISFGTKNEEGIFTPLKSESWLFKGQFYINTIQKQSTGNTIAEALLEAIAGVVTQIQTTSGLKQQLIDNDELVINPDALNIFKNV